MDKNQDYMDLRSSFTQEYPSPTAYSGAMTNGGKPDFTPGQSNFFMLALVLVNIFLQITLAVIGAGGALGGIPTWLMMLGGQVMMLGIPCTIYLIIKRRHIRELLPLRRLGIANIFLITGLTLAAIPLLGMVNLVSQLVFPNIIGEVAQNVMLEGGLWLSLAVFAVVPQIFEEVAFRGIGMAGFKHAKISTVAIINGLIFGYIHMNMNQFAYAFVGGIIFCYMAYYTKSIWAPILSHFIVNGLAAVVMFTAMGDEVVEMADLQTILQYEMATYGDIVMAMFFVIAAVVILVFIGIFIGLFLLFRWHNLRRNDAAGIVTNTAAAARSAGLPCRRAFTPSFWIATVIFIFMMASVYLLPLFLEVGIQ